MAECMDEFDEATPLRGTYCSRLTSEEYEEQSARWALNQIVDSYTVQYILFFRTQLYRAGPERLNEAIGQ